jgi:cytochrome c1
MPRFFFLTMLLLAASARAELVATFSREGVTDARRDRFPALSIQKGEPATPFLAPGSFDVVWTGKLVLGKRQRLAFSFEGEGAAALKIDGEELLKREGTLAGEPSETKRLNPGEHTFELTYKSKEDGSAAFQVYWEEAGFVRQTIPATAFAAEATDATTIGELHRSGRLLFTQQNCAKCHSSAEGFGATPMPETGEIGPILMGIGARATEGWLRQWISDPKAQRPTTHMPTLVNAETEEGRQQASDLAAYLMTLKMGGAPGTAPDAALADKGGINFHELGCVACHNTPDKTSDAWDRTRVPLNHVASKYQPGALVAYLKKPDAFHPFTQMPDFKMSDDEANSIAAFLIKTSSGKETKRAEAIPAGDAARGEKVAASLQCGTCHPGLPIGAEQPLQLEAIFKKDWAEKGCVAPADKRGKAPMLNLTDDGRAALVSFGKMGGDSLKRDTPAEFATRQMQTLRCIGCHAIDDKQPLLNSVHEETKALTEGHAELHERVDQTRPQLTYIGEMLYTTYIEKMLDGSAAPRPRPWLGTRMPAFRAHAKVLAPALSRLHGVEPGGPVKVEIDPAMVEIGKKLVGSDVGFGCTTCHGVGPLKPTAAFEVEGINFQLVPDRLRPEYYHRWMDNPQLVNPGTKMPKYAEGNASQRTDILDGDASKQYDAIWQFLHAK